MLGSYPLNKAEASAITNNGEGVCPSQYPIVTPVWGETIKQGEAVQVLALAPRNADEATILELKAEYGGLGPETVSGEMIYNSLEGEVWEFIWYPQYIAQYRLSVNAIFADSTTLPCGAVEVNATSDNDTYEPKGSILKPAGNEQIQGLYPIQVTALDNQKIDRILVNVTEPVSITLQNPDICGAGCYEFSLNIGLDGVYTIETKALDTSGNTGTDRISVIVGDQPPLSIDVNLTERQVITNRYNIDVTVTGGIGVKHVFLDISGPEPYQADEWSAPFRFPWDPRVDGDYQVKIEAIDTASTNYKAVKIVNVDVLREGRYEATEGVWEKIKTSISPDLFAGAMVDTGKGVYLFGGWRGSFSTVLVETNELWTWNGSAWTNLTPSPLPNAWPNPRKYNQIAYDRHRDRLVMFGGAEFKTTYRDVWEYDLQTGVWYDRTPSSLPAGWPTGPNGPDNVRMTYDAVHRKTVLVRFDNTWLWNGVTGAWEHIVTPEIYNGNSTYQKNQSVVYDSDRGIVVLYTCYDGARDTTWEWDGAAWHKVADSNTSFTPLLFPSSLSDSPSRMFLLGGDDGYSFNRAELWDWNGSSWTKITALAGDPPETEYEYANAAYDSAHKKLVLLTMEGETWVYSRRPVFYTAEPYLFTTRDSNDVLYGPGMKLEWSPIKNPKVKYYEI